VNQMLGGLNLLLILCAYAHKDVPFHHTSQCKVKGPSPAQQTMPTICLHRWPAMEAVVKLMIRHMVVLGSDSDIFERTVLNILNCFSNTLLLRGHLLPLNRRHL
jgi:hypothetical protein